MSAESYVYVVAATDGGEAIAVVHSEVLAWAAAAEDAKKVEAGSYGEAKPLTWTIERNHYRPHETSLSVRRAPADTEASGSGHAMAEYTVTRMGGVDEETLGIEEAVRKGWLAPSERYVAAGPFLAGRYRWTRPPEPGVMPGVEVSFDDGETWQECEVEANLGGWDVKTPPPPTSATGYGAEPRDVLVRVEDQVEPTSSAVELRATLDPTWALLSVEEYPTHGLIPSPSMASVSIGRQAALDLGRALLSWVGGRG